MNEWVPQTNIKGPIGPIGPIGPPGPGVVFKGSVPSEGDLPAGASPGDMYITEDTDTQYVWDGTTWIAGTSLTGPPGHRAIPVRQHGAGRPVPPARCQVRKATRATRATPATLARRAIPVPPTRLAIGTVTTVAPGGAATSTITGTSPNQTLNLGIPSGLQGATGSTGPQGNPGADGATIPPATVTPLMDGTGAVGTTTKYAREDHRHPTDTSRAASTHTHAQADVTNLVTDLAAKAPLASPTFTGDPKAPTPSPATTTRRLRQPRSSPPR